MDYRAAGVDVEAGDQFVDWISEQKSSSKRIQDKMIGGVGGFAAITRFQFPEMTKPCIVTCTDGVGTKVKLASHFQNFSTVGQDLVAMCVNDLITSGAEPFLFLDYYATGKLHLPWAKEFLAGLEKACVQAEVALVGGETAEMPGVYAPGDFDCAGFAVGVVDEPKILGAARVKDGDQVLAVSSSGFHSNGYSLIRKVFEEDLDLFEKELLTPTSLYTRLVKNLVKVAGVRAFANITGGGMENIPRSLPRGASLKLQTWTLPKMFQLVLDRTRMSPVSLLKTLNCGVGFVVVVAPDSQGDAERIIREQGFETWPLGRVETVGVKAEKESFIDYGAWEQ